MHDDNSSVNKENFSMSDDKHKNDDRKNDGSHSIVDDMPNHNDYDTLRLR